MSDGKAQAIDRVYLLSHTHTDFGYTDQVEAVLLHHRDILDRALEVCEESFDEPEGCQHRWTCELTSTTLDYLRNATPKNVDRFRRLHEADRIAVGALRYHWTPLASRPLAEITLRDIDALRDEFGIKVRSAMQCDVNGLAWFWADLLAARGVGFLSTHQNPHRGYWGENVPSLWTWEGREGGRLLVHQGEHYAVGGFHVRIGKPGEADTEELAKFLDRHARSDRWPCGFSVLTVTNSAHGDNVYPQGELSRAVREWNGRGEGPQIEIVSLDGLADVLARQPDVPSVSGEWMDSWCDGVASTPVETALARAAERLIPVIERLGPPGDGSFEAMAEALALYDEHTWGSYTAASAPKHVLTTMQRVKKSSFAHDAFTLALRTAAKSSRAAAAAQAGAPVEGDPSFDRTSDPELGPEEQSYWVMNPTDLPMEVDWPVPPDRGAGPQISIPQAYSDDSFMPGFSEDRQREAAAADGAGYGHRIRASLGPGESAIVRPAQADPTDCAAGEGWIENRHSRVEVCAETGGIARWLDKESGTEVLSGSAPLLSAGVHLLREGFVRKDIFQAPYWERSETPMRWNPGELFEDDERSVSVSGGKVDADGAAVTVAISFASGIKATSEIRLPATGRQLRVRAMQDTGGLERCFSIFWPLGGLGKDSRILCDTGGGLVDCETGHVPGSCLRWQSVQSGIALARDDGSSVAVASPDAPLFQPGGPSWKDPHDPPASWEGGCFWTVNNHWDTNFPVAAFDPAPARFVLRFLPPSSGEDAADVLRGLVAAPVIVRVPRAKAG